MWYFMIDDEFKKTSLTNECLLTTTKLKFNGTGIPSMGKNSMFFGSVEKGLTMLKLMYKKHKFFNVQKIETDKGDIINVVSIKATKENTFLFEGFRKLGFTTPGFNIGFMIKDGECYAYLNRKLFKDIGRLKENVKAYIVGYLISVAYFLFFSTQHICFEPSFNFEYSEFDNTLSINGEELNVLDWVLSFDGLTKVSVRDFDEIENILSLHCIKTEYTGIKTLIDNDIMGGYSLCKDESGIKYLIYKHGLVDGPGVYYVFNADTGIITTNNIITSDELKEDSLLMHFLSLINHKSPTINANLKHSPFPGKHSFEIIDEEAPEYKELLEYLSKKGISEHIPLKTLKEIFGDCFKSSLIELDRDAFIEQYKDDKFALELLKNRFDYYDTFELPFDVNFLKGVVTGEVYSMLFTGESGTGKTTAAKVICDRIGLPLVTINLSLNCEESDIFGCMIPNPYKEKPEDPEFIWKDGPATKAIRNGYALSLEEINGGRPGVLMKLNSLLDETRQIELSSGEIVKAHKNFRIFATCNIGYEGTNRFNSALVNRFEIVKIFEEPEKEACFNIIRNRLGYSDISKMENIWLVYLATKKYCQEQNLNVIISIRQLLNIFRIGKYYNNAREAYIDIVLNNAFLEEAEHLQNFIETVLDSIPLKFKL